MPLKRVFPDAAVGAADAPPQQKPKLANPPEYESRLVDATVRSAVEALLKDASAREKKRALRAAETGKSLADLMASEVFVYLGLTLKEPPAKSRLRPYSLYVLNRFLLLLALLKVTGSDADWFF